MKKGPLEKAKEIARELISLGVKAVVLSGSTVKGEENPNDLDFLVFGKLNSIRDLEKSLGEKYEIPVHLFVFNEEYLDSLIDAYKRNKDLLGFSLGMDAQQGSGRSLSWPLIPLLSDEEFQDFFGQYLGYSGPGHRYIQREYIILEGQDYLEVKRKELHLKRRE